MANISIISETTKEKGRKKTAAISTGSYCRIVNLLHTVEQFYNGIVYAVSEQLAFFFNSPVFGYTLFYINDYRILVAEAFNLSSVHQIYIHRRKDRMERKNAPEDRCSRCNFFIRGVGGGYLNTTFFTVPSFLSSGVLTYSFPIYCLFPA